MQGSRGARPLHFGSPAVFREEPWLCVPVLRRVCPIGVVPVVGEFRPERPIMQAKLNPARYVVLRHKNSWRVHSLPATNWA